MVTSKEREGMLLDRIYVISVYHYLTTQSTTIGIVKH